MKNSMDQSLIEFKIRCVGFCASSHSEDTSEESARLTNFADPLLSLWMTLEYDLFPKPYLEASESYQSTF